MASGLNKAVARAMKHSSALERIEKVEQDLNGIVHPALFDFRQTLETLQDAVNAIASIVGVEEIGRAIVQVRERRQSREREVIEQNIRKLVETGHLVKAATIAPNSILVGVRRDPEGNAAPYHEFVELSHLVPEIQSSLIGRTAEGAEVALVDNVKFVVLEAFDQVENPVQTPAVDQPAKAPEPPTETPPMESAPQTA